MYIKNILNSIEESNKIQFPNLYQYNKDEIDWMLAYTDFLGIDNEVAITKFLNKHLPSQNIEQMHFNSTLFFYIYDLYIVCRCKLADIKSDLIKQTITEFEQNSILNIDAIRKEISLPIPEYVFSKYKERSFSSEIVNNHMDTVDSSLKSYRNNVCPVTKL
ncbi:hypothetical protein [Clostridium intestinale]|uniref:Uncharacterized protein n=1 Tax=Clostridium intestinale DSM 6191 TaxID=1121320 RepID=A0A1M6AKM0_9CLOT|nr:hypothetical protein [Clostridium intestinale]SHI37030.1 hypothetical protein SAMN02745941_03690 [Clostridium intestinale DSM 6191]